MPRFFCDAIAGGKAVITGEDAAHIARSLRMQPGERLTLSDGQGTDFDCVLDLVTPQEVFLTVLESYPCRTEPSVYVRLYMAMPKAEKLELIVQKAVELGVGEIIPVLTRRCVSRPDSKSFEKKRVRLARIAAEAAKQAGRAMLPHVALPLNDFAAVFKAFADFDVVLFFYEGGGAPLREVLHPGQYKRVAIVTGSEGGFSVEEAEAAKAAGAVTVGLGPRILRCETAPLAALTSVMLLTGNLE